MPYLSWPDFYGCLSWLAERCRQRIGILREQPDIRADGDEAIAPLDVAARIRLDCGEDAGHLAGIPDPLRRRFDRALNVRMQRIADMPHRCTEIGGADE